MKVFLKSFSIILLLIILSCIVFGENKAESKALFSFISEEGYIGFINIKGEVVIKPQYYDAMYVREGLVRITVIKQTFWGNKKYQGLVNSKGEVIVKPKYRRIHLFSDGVAKVEINFNTTGFINTEGKVMFKSRRKNLGQYFGEGLLPFSRIGFSKENKSGYLDKKGKIAIKPQFSSASGFREGLASVSITKDGKNIVGYIDKTGKFVFEPKVIYSTKSVIEQKVIYSTGYFYNGRALVKIGYHRDSLKIGYIDKTGKMVIESRFHDQKNFWNGYALVSEIIDGEIRWGFINPSGEYQIPPQFLEAKSFSDGVACVKLENGKYGGIDSSGNFVIEPKYDSPFSFLHGLARITTNDGYQAYMNPKGEIVFRYKSGPKKIPPRVKISWKNKLYKEIIFWTIIILSQILINFIFLFLLNIDLILKVKLKIKKLFIISLFVSIITILSPHYFHGFIFSIFSIISHFIFKTFNILISSIWIYLLTYLLSLLIYYYIISIKYLKLSKLRAFVISLIMTVFVSYIIL
ncbi:WG repeat-containing protein, partial [Candidatus Dependentiae bacterium]|nr:WG repeat-containing protein [Candidatus Dependentiae bacterium]